MNIYVIITCCLLENQKEIRKEQYINGINQTIKLFKNIDNPNVKKLEILIVENNHTENTKTFLDEFNLPVFYTKNNHINYTNNKGYKELKDVNYIIDKLNLNENDFIIKLTGRYFIKDDSNFIQVLNNLNLENYDAILRYGGYNLKEIFNEKHLSCHTSLIGMKIKYIKSIQYPGENICVEWKWSEATYPIPYERLYILENLGIKCFINTDINPTHS